MKDNLDEIFGRIQGFECPEHPSQGDIFRLLDIMHDLVVEVRRIENANIKAFNYLEEGAD